MFTKEDNRTHSSRFNSGKFFEPYVQPREATDDSAKEQESAKTALQSPGAETSRDAFISPRPVIQQKTGNVPEIQRTPEDATTKEPELKQDETPENPRIELGRKIFQEFASGLTIAFYETDDPVFKGDADKWAKTHGAIGLNGNQISVENVVFGKGIPEKGIKTTDKKKRALSVAEVISQFGKLLQECVSEAFLADKGVEIDKATLDLYKFKIVALGSHGWDGGTSLDIDDSNIGAFLETTSPYMRNDVNVIFYACTVSKDPDEDYDQWMKVFNTDGGENSITAKARDKLADLGHTQGEVWGHTAVGHFLRNYTLRRFKVSDKGAEGESFLLYCFGDEIDNMVNEIVTRLKADTEYKTPIDDKKIEEIWDILYAIVKEDFRSCYSSANSKLKIDINGEQKNLAEEAPVYPDKVKAIILDYRSTQWKKKFVPETAIGQVIKKVKAKK